MTTALLIAGIVAIASMAIWLLARYAVARGRAAVESEMAKRGLEHVRKARKARARLHSLSDDERDRWLLKRDKDS